MHEWSEESRTKVAKTVSEQMAQLTPEQRKARSRPANDKWRAHAAEMTFDERKAWTAPARAKAFERVACERCGAECARINLPRHMGGRKCK